MPSSLFFFLKLFNYLESLLVRYIFSEFSSSSSVKMQWVF